MEKNIYKVSIGSDVEYKDYFTENFDVVESHKFEFKIKLDFHDLEKLSEKFGDLLINFVGRSIYIDEYIEEDDGLLKLNKSKE